MPSLRELRRKVKSVKSTQQITKAMKMVAAARLRRAQARILGARPFALRMQELLSDILLSVADVNKDRVLSAEELTHPLLKPRASGVRGLLLITSDKGLCGAFNTNLLKKALEFMRENEGRPLAVFCVGRKGRDFFRRVKEATERRCDGNSGSTRASDAGNNAAPPAPCATRPRTSHAGVGASPHAIDDAVKQSSPEKNRRRRP